MDSKSVEAGILLVAVVTQYLQFYQVEGLWFSFPLQRKQHLTFLNGIE